MVHVPKDQADDVDMEEDDEDNEEAQFLPSLQVIDRPQEQSTEKEGGSSLQREEPSQGRADPEFKGTVESLSRENKHIILETEDDDLVECTIKWLSMYNKTVQKKILERVVKEETKEEEKEEVEVEEEQQEPAEPTVPPPTMVSMECQTDDSYLKERLEALRSKRNQFHLKALRRKRYQGNHRQIFRKMIQLQNKNLPKDFTPVLTSLAMKTIQFFENLLSVLLLVTMMYGQASTIKVIQACKPWLLKKTTGLPTLMIG
jgi:hypothetical protein